MRATGVRSAPTNRLEGLLGDLMQCAGTRVLAHGMWFATIGEPPVDTETMSA